MFNMKNFILAIACFAAAVSSASIPAKKGDWIMGGGFGMMFNPSLVLFSPQLEYVYDSNLLVGPLVQIAPGTLGVVFTASAAARMFIGSHPKLKPCLEGGFGFAMVGASPGVLIHGGMGFDYIVDNKITIGTMFRANFAPPATTFFVTWPIIVGRIIL